MKRPYVSARTRLGLALAAASLASVALFVAGAWDKHEHDFAYMIWNLFLAWIPFVITLWLVRVLNRSLWSSWYALGLTLLWIVFLPNSFYMLTDLIHIRDLSETNLINGVVMFSSFILIGLWLGLASVYLVHRQLAKRLRPRTAFFIVEFVLLLCSFAIYVGRDLRWNSWDVVTNPAALLFDVTDHIFSPAQHPQTFAVTAGFFVLLSSLYAVIWYTLRMSRQLPES